MQTFLSNLLTPFYALRLRYVPLLLIYFAYGSTVFVAIARDFWVKQSLSLSAEALLSLGVWLSVPWTIKMIFGQLVDSVTLFGSNRKVYVYIGALLMTLSTLLFIGMVGEHTWVAGYSKEHLYIVASVIGVVGMVLQDVVADTMTTEVVEPHSSEEERRKELATIQVLSRLSLGFAIFMMGWLGGEVAERYGYEMVFILSLFIPLLSILGVSVVSLTPVAPVPLNKKIFFGGVLFALFVIAMGYNEVPYSQEIVFLVSLGVVLYFLKSLIEPLDATMVRHIKMAMIVIFVYRAMPSVGPALQWWEIDVLGFDEAFFAKLSMIGGGIALAGMWFGASYLIRHSIGRVLVFLTLVSTLLSLPILGLYYNLHTLLGVDARTVALVDTALASPFDYIAGVLMLTLVAIYAPEGNRGTWFALMASFMNIALSASGLLSKYLNQLFVVTREVKEGGMVVVSANYEHLGILLWIVTLLGLIIPLITIWRYNPDLNIKETDEK